MNRFVQTAGALAIVLASAEPIGGAGDSTDFSTDGKDTIDALDIRSPDPFGKPRFGWPPSFW